MKIPKVKNGYVEKYQSQNDLTDSNTARLIDMILVIKDTCDTMVYLMREEIREIKNIATKSADHTHEQLMKYRSRIALLTAEVKDLKKKKSRL